LYSKKTFHSDKVCILKVSSSHLLDHVAFFFSLLLLFSQYFFLSQNAIHFWDSRLSESF
jgi:hypothetical protein